MNIKQYLELQQSVLQRLQAIADDVQEANKMTNGAFFCDPCFEKTLKRLSLRHQRKGLIGLILMYFGR